MLCATAGSGSWTMKNSLLLPQWILQSTIVTHTTAKHTNTRNIMVARPVFFQKIMWIYMDKILNSPLVTTSQPSIMRFKESRHVSEWAVHYDSRLLVCEGLSVSARGLRQRAQAFSDAWSMRLVTCTSKYLLILARTMSALHACSEHNNFNFNLTCSFRWLRTYR